MDPDTVDLQPILGVMDPMLEQLALSVITALQRPEDAYNGLYIDQVATMAAAHLLRHYAARPAARVLSVAGGRAEPGLWRCASRVGAGACRRPDRSCARRTTGIAGARGGHEPNHVRPALHQCLR